MIVFGPVPSRRLGQSLGINMIPSGFCTYSCVYCQLGRTRHLTCREGHWHEAGDIVKAVAVKLEEVKSKGTGVDWLSFVPEGEPTLGETPSRENSPYHTVSRDTDTSHRP